MVSVESGVSGKASTEYGCMGFRVRRLVISDGIKGCGAGGGVGTPGIAM